MTSTDKSKFMVGGNGRCLKELGKVTALSAVSRRQELGWTGSDIRVTTNEVVYKTLVLPV